MSRQVLVRALTCRSGLWPPRVKRDEGWPVYCPRWPPGIRALLLLYVALALSIVGACVGCGSGPSLAVKVAGNQLVDVQGQPIRLLGVDRSGAEYACIHGRGLLDGPTDRRAIAAMTAWRINAVRIPLNEDCWLGINGAPPHFSGI